VCAVLNARPSESQPSTAFPPRTACFDDSRFCFDIAISEETEILKMHGMEFENSGLDLCELTCELFGIHTCARRRGPMARTNQDGLQIRGPRVPWLAYDVGNNHFDRSSKILGTK
jgi:hypothetical protein